ncbi:MAG: hypothetical protein ACR2PQ_09045 [Myxococcota bacterium]
MLNRTRAILIALAAGCAALVGIPGSAIDTMAVAPTYYQELATDGDLSALESESGGLPDTLHILDAEGGIEYRTVRAEDGVVHWTVEMEMKERAHERVDTVYDLVLALPLPVEFAAQQWGISVREGAQESSVPFVYGGEKVTLKRNIGLEKLWLPSLVGSPEGLPDLSGTGYVLTLWDAILRYDSGRGPYLQAVADFAYTTPAGVAAPDPDDDVFAGYLITWIPTLAPSVAPYTIRLDVQPPSSE